MAKTKPAFDDLLTVRTRAELRSALDSARLTLSLPQVQRLAAHAASLEPAAQALRLAIVHTYTSNLLDPWLAMAAALRGRPYQYGASGPASFDCSGFTRYVFGHALGRSLVHNAAAQYADSLKLDRSAVRPGDLVFYTSGGWVYHVGIYAGGGLIWDAPHTGETVRLERIATSSWVAGRVL